MIYVVAGSHAQAELWAEERYVPRSDWRYVNYAYQLRGLRRPHVVFTGTWDERGDLVELRRTLQVIESSVVYESTTR